MTEEDERIKCLATGVLLGRSAEDLDREAGRALAQGEELELAASVMPGMGMVARGRARVALEARAVDRLLTKSEACGVDKNGHLAGEFGRLEDWSSMPLPDLASRASDFHRAVYQLVGYELKGKAREEGERPFDCSECGGEFNTLEEYRAHQNVTGHTY